MEKQSISYTVRRTYVFQASHNLPGRELHQHEFKVVVEYIGVEEQFKEGMLINCFDMNKIWRQEVVHHLHGKYLNDIVGEYPTGEYIAKWIFDRFKAHTAQYSSAVLKSVSVFDGDFEASYLQH